MYWIHFIKYTLNILNIHTFTYQKTSLHTLLLLVFKIVESLQCILNHEPFLLMIVYETARLCHSKGYFISVSWNYLIQDIETVVKKNQNKAMWCLQNWRSVIKVILLNKLIFSLIMISNYKSSLRKCLPISIIAL